MIDLHQHLQELADAAARDGTIPGPAHAVRRGRQRRRRIAAGVASLLAVALVAGTAIHGRLIGQPAPAPDVPTVTQPTPTPDVPTVTQPPAPLPPLPNLRALHDKPRPGSVEERTFKLLANELRRCPGGGSSIRANLIGYIWSAKYRQLLMVAAKQPPPQETRFCWTVGWSGRSSWGVLGARRVGANGTPLTFTGNIESGFAQIAGRVTKQATRVRLRFRDGRPPMDLVVIEAGDRYPVNFYAGFFRQGPTSPQQGGWAAATLTALDAAGRTVATCRVGPPGDGTPKCPGN